MGNGVQVNASEKRFYTYTKEHLDNTPLLPIIQSCSQNNWLLQKRVITYEEYEGDDKPDFNTLLEKINERLGPFSGLITDKTRNNIGYVDGDCTYSTTDNESN